MTSRGLFDKSSGNTSDLIRAVESPVIACKKRGKSVAALVRGDDDNRKNLHNVMSLDDLSSGGDTNNLIATAESQAIVHKKGVGPVAAHDSLHDKDSNKIIPTTASKFQVITRKERIGSAAASGTKETRKKVAPDADDDDDDNNNFGNNNDDDYNNAAGLFNSLSNDEDNDGRKGSRQKKGKKRLGNARKVSAAKEAKNGEKALTQSLYPLPRGKFLLLQE
jgi:hypothetical protein